MQISPINYQYNQKNSLKNTKNRQQQSFGNAERALLESLGVLHLDKKAIKTNSSFVSALRKIFSSRESVVKIGKEVVTSFRAPKNLIADSIDVEKGVAVKGKYEALRGDIDFKGSLNGGILLSERHVFTKSPILSGSIEGKGDVHLTSDKFDGLNVKGRNISFSQTSNNPNNTVTGSGEKADIFCFLADGSKITADKIFAHPSSTIKDAKLVGEELNILGRVLGKSELTAKKLILYKTSEVSPEVKLNYKELIDLRETKEI